MTRSKRFFKHSCHCYKTAHSIKPYHTEVRGDLLYGH